MARAADRSRSPAGGGNGEWISRQVAALARYANKRPQGLVVDASGGFRLSVLMSTWGLQNGVSRQSVLKALEEHKFHDSQGTLRFAMSPESAGDFTIRVHKRKDNVKEPTTSQPIPGPVLIKPPLRPGFGAQAAAQVASPQHQWREQRPGAGCVVRPPPWSPRSSLGPGPAGQTPKAPPAVKKELGTWESRPWEAKPQAQLWSDGWKKTKEMWPRSTAWDTKDQQWPSKNGWVKGAADKWAGGCDGEKVQQWMDFALRNGHKLGVVVEADGWASIDDLAEVMSQKKPELGVADGQRLREVLQDTDALGRFEVDERGRVRKAVQAEADGDAEASGSAEAGEADEGTPPDMPPGPGWTKYRDENVDWWYYEGPLGKWWLQGNEKRPKVWTDECEEESLG